MMHHALADGGRGNFYRAFSEVTAAQAEISPSAVHLSNQQRRLHHRTSDSGEERSLQRCRELALCRSAFGVLPRRYCGMLYGRSGRAISAGSGCFSQRIGVRGSAYGQRRFASYSDSRRACFRRFRLRPDRPPICPRREHTCAQNLNDGSKAQRKRFV
jgi:hypothetical protein